MLRLLSKNSRSIKIELRKKNLWRLYNNSRRTTLIRDRKCRTNWFNSIVRTRSCDHLCRNPHRNRCSCSCSLPRSNLCEIKAEECRSNEMVCRESCCRYRMSWKYRVSRCVVLRLNTTIRFVVSRVRVRSMWCCCRNMMILTNDIRRSVKTTVRLKFRIGRCWISINLSVRRNRKIFKCLQESCRI